MEGITVGVFGSQQEARAAVESALAKKSEAEGISVYHRTEGGRKISFLDGSDYPDRIQGYARVASISDYAFYVFPDSGKLSTPDGELAVLLEAFRLPGSIQLLDGAASPDAAVGALKGTAVAGYRVEERSASSSVVDLSGVRPRDDFTGGTLVYVDRVFTVKGVGTVALGFILSGSVSVHDQLRPIPGPSGLRIDVKGIQVNDEDFDSAGRGIRVGLSLRGVEARDLEKCHWLDDGSFTLADRLSLQFTRSQYYRQPLGGRDLHLQLPGEMVTAKLADGADGALNVALPFEVPAWEGMRTSVIDLNGKPLRIAGGGTCKF